MNACPICGRSPKGFGYRNPHDPTAPRLGACSMTCLNEIARRKGAMAGNYLDKFEEEAVKAGSEAGGAYLESLGKYDLSLLSPSEWRLFIAKVFASATAKVRELVAADDDVPF